MTLRLQILTLLFSTIVVVAAAFVGTAWYNTSQSTRTQVDSTLAVATDTFKQVLRSREDQLINSAELLTSDFGFKQAVATQDTPTINSALFNHGDRVKADLMFLTSLDGTLQASTHTALEVRRPFPHLSLIEAAESQGGALSFVRVEQRIYQLVVVTVVAPVPIGFAGVGFELDQAVAEELHRLANVEVTFSINGPNGPRLLSTLSPGSIEAATRATSTLGPEFALPFRESATFVTSQVELTGAEPDLGTAFLSVELTPYLAEFRSLRDEIILITLLALFLSGIVSLFLSRGITTPIHQLIVIAQQIARGNYRVTARPGRGAREVTTLFNAVSKMGSDIEERERHIAFQAEHDNLTRLYHRTTFTEKLDAWIEEESSSCVTLCLNIKGFRAINDSFGPTTGDRCLQQVASRLEACTKSAGIVGRYGGDEFIVALSLDAVTPAMRINRVVSLLEEPIHLDDLELNLAFAVGYATCPEDGESADTLMRRSTIALDRARSEGAPLRRYQAGEEEEHGHKLRLTRDLRTALEADDGQLFMNYQPKLHLATGHVDKMEALIRWVHPEEGFISPELFIALAEQSNLIMKLTDWVIERVIRDRAGWQAHHPDLQIAINVSAQDLERDDLLDKTLSGLDSHGLRTRALCFEMTERDMMKDSEKAFSLMLKYREAGFDLSVDDYGIGQSSLSKLKQMPVSEIKIDKLFVTHLENSTDDQTIVLSTIKLGHDFGLRVIAEGVESAAATDLLRTMNCDYIQGYHLSRPMKAEDVSEWLTNFSDQPDPVAGGNVANS